jgi:hypothetical protein
MGLDGGLDLLNSCVYYVQKVKRKKRDRITVYGLGLNPVRYRARYLLSSVDTHLELPMKLFT